MEDRQVDRTFNLDALSVLVEYNILLIGADNESKTSFINSFSNYVKSDSLDKTKDGKLEKSMLSTFDQTQNVYTFRLNCKLIRLIDTPANYDISLWGPKNDFIRAIRKCALYYPRLHAIVVVVNVNGSLLHEYIFEKKLLPLLPIIHKSACDNVVLCFTSNSAYEFSNETFEQLQSYIRSYTKIQTPKHGQNLLTIGKFVFKCYDESTKLYRSNWIDASEQIETMLDWVERGEPCALTNVVEFTQTYQILYYSMGIGIAYYYDKYPIYNPKSIQAKFLKQNPTEYERFEEIFLNLFALMMHLTMIHPFAFVEKLIKHAHDENYKNYKEFFKKLRLVSENCDQSVEVKLGQCSATEYFHELFNYLYTFRHLGPYFRYISIYQIKLQLESTELQYLLSILTQNNVLLFKCEGKAKQDMSNVTFSCLTSRVVDLFHQNSTAFPNINQEDIQFVLENMDSLIKYNLDMLFCVIRRYVPMEDDSIAVDNAIHEQQDDDDDDEEEEECCCVII